MCEESEGEDVKRKVGGKKRIIKEKMVKKQLNSFRDLLSLGLVIESK